MNLDINFNEFEITLMTSQDLCLDDDEKVFGWCEDIYNVGEAARDGGIHFPYWKSSKATFVTLMDSHSFLEQQARYHKYDFILCLCWFVMSLLGYDFILSWVGISRAALCHESVGCLC